VDQICLDLFYEGVQPSEIMEMTLAQLKHFGGYCKIIQKARIPKTPPGGGYGR
jgi:hypothetical protein